MKRIEYRGIEIDRCTRCYGLWFDNFELEELNHLTGSEVIDIGDTDLGHEQNARTHILCPQCSPPVLMRSESDKKQPHIQFERCPKCKGVYFDAGEFRDYKELTISEFFKSIFSK
ncbi:MAG: zf-TFIIB domain-containing protein [Candidatus Marinimicrobia bacterium]|nr:zf-TFIIB domain-containing protein [Candidatus Neomarinimicrobiota bacterium]